MEQILKVEGLCRDYGRGAVTRAVDHVDIAVEKGEFVGIMGPSGSGKTTLLNCISTIDTPTAGHIWVEGRDITALKQKQLSRFRRERLGFIFQDCNLLDTLTAFENVALALTIRGAPAGEIAGRVRETAELLDIANCLDKYPYQLSGGQRQRAAAARAIVTDPALVLADEPTGALDSRASARLLELFETINQEGQTILMVTHSVEAASHAGRVLFLRDGQVYHQLYREGAGRERQYRRIADVLTQLTQGGEQGA